MDSTVALTRSIAGATFVLVANGTPSGEPTAGFRDVLVEPARGWSSTTTRSDSKNAVAIS